MPPKGQHLSNEARKKISLSRIGKYYSSNNPNWKGGKMLLDGYIYIYSPNHPFKTKGNYVAEHRLIMEKKLKRFLKKYEVVHHINGIRIDNRIKNLVLCVSIGKHFIKHHFNLRDKFGKFCK